MLPKVSAHRFCCAPFTNGEHVRRSYLLPRLLRDELRLIQSVLGGAPGAA